MSSDSNPADIPAATTTDSPKYETLKLNVPQPFVYHVELQRPEKYNAMNRTMWIEIGNCFNELAENGDCRVIVLTGAGKHFTTGIDLTDMAELGSELAAHEDVARRCKLIKKMIQTYQESITSLEKCCKPVIGAIHGACIGGGVDLISATDIRFCTADAWFQVKEVDIGMAADVGTLQRLPRLIGSASLVNELVFTARKLPSNEAKDCGFIGQVFADRNSMLQSTIDLAAKVAEKSPLAVQGSKLSLIYSRDHTVQEGLDHIALWNQTMLQSEDFMNASVAQATKSPPPQFSKL
ncbi:delta(3,5)-Delta(2,4)-dienoyl-CoA isomerase, mitochondrial isoform X2 [Lycorma delicatula]